MDRFGFNKVSASINLVKREFLQKGVQLAREEMLQNIETQSSAESGKSYPELTYFLDWPYPHEEQKQPPRLILTGSLLEEITSNQIQFRGDSAVLIIDPIDERGKGYASYHEDGVNQYKSKEDFQAEFVTQSESLAEKQVSLLTNLVNQSFNSK